MNRTPLVVIIVGIAVLIALLDFWIPAELAGSALFTFPLVLCIIRRSKWLLWGISAIAALASVAAEIWGFHRIALPQPVGRFDQPWTSHGDSSYPCDTDPSVDE